MNDYVTKPRKLFSLESVTVHWLMIPSAVRRGDLLAAIARVLTLKAGGTIATTTDMPPIFAR